MSCPMPLRMSRSRIPAVPVSIVTNESREACLPRALQGGFRGGAASQQVELVPDRALRRGANVFELVPGNRGENVGRARCARSAGGGALALRMHQAAVADGGQDRGERKFGAENVYCAGRIAARPRHCAGGTSWIQKREYFRAAKFRSPRRHRDSRRRLAAGAAPPCGANPQCSRREARRASAATYSWATRSR